MNDKRQILKYILSDFTGSFIGWFLFNIFRYHIVGYLTMPSLSSFLTFRTVVEGQIISPFMWVFLFFLSGYYNRPFLKSRFEELKTTLSSVFLGTLFVFFIVVLDDMPLNPSSYIDIMAGLFLIEFFFVYILRYIITTRATHKIHGARLGYNTVIIGTGKNANKFRKELLTKKQNIGYRIIGYVEIENEKIKVPKNDVLGSFEEIDSIIKHNKIENIIFAPDTRNPKVVFGIIQKLFPYKLGIRMKANMEDILFGKVKMYSLYEPPMIDISRAKLSDGQVNMKRLGDIIVSLLIIILISPLYITLYILIKLDSKGPAIYKQERIGRFGDPFYIYKFRTMYNNAEDEGPQLSEIGDTRITPLGFILRKYRLDELPQFLNVLKGDMSLVGPRPERGYYIDQIVKKAPYYCLVQQVRPGITSWGMVKYGYASNVEQMVERLKYDILYLENLSLVVDCKILIYTVRTVLTGKGI